MFVVELKFFTLCIKVFFLKKKKNDFIFISLIKFKLVTNVFLYFVFELTDN